MKSKLIPQRGNVNGNLIWSPVEINGKENLIKQSLSILDSMGYWASPFPEKDGVTFRWNDEDKPTDQVVQDFVSAFPWLDIELSESGDANLELAELASGMEIPCTIIVPLECIFIEESFAIGDYQFICRREFDESPHERLGDFDSEYLQFDALLSYPDLLRINRAVAHNDVVINKCLSLAEHAMDIIRYQFSSFLRPEFTPNPAGQQANGFYSIEIIPKGKTYLKPLSLSGITRPLSSSNNWLGPEVEHAISPGYTLLHDILAGRSDELGLLVKATLRGCRQSFYAPGEELKFLNLVFALDGLTHPAQSWSGWQHRTYLAALISHGNASYFANILRRYDELYANVRNKLVHGGKDFYELAYEPSLACDDIYEYIKSVIHLIEAQQLSTIADLHNYARQLLNRSEIKDSYTQVIQEICAQRGSTGRMPSW
ncbi:hypothetical protein [Pseudomonas oryziphila]|uniref:Apea-like HEPN domain-containing protein n=1 Tax=Pseudomonas entomophila TaxID=312306 RepID=A0A3Q8TZU9_9PSED|nr:hypothetical protein [Pseudomonas oryziphila]AZL68216.1 hypothetical protein EJA05_10935 [Pseudomonas oryziphila]